MVNNAKYRMTNFAIALTVSVIGALLMMGIDLGGTRWLKFVLYVGFFLLIMSPLFFSSSLSCSMFSRSRKRN